MNNPFVHLHLHTLKSIADSMIKPEALANKLESLGMKSVAVTDHGTMLDIVEIYSVLKKSGIKTIFGLETYIAPRGNTLKEHGIDDANYHLVLLAENLTGYHNLIKIASDAATEGKYYKERTDFDHLRQYHEGIIASSACLGGQVQQEILLNGYEAGLKCAKRYNEIFGQGNFFLELQDHGIPEQQIVNEALFRMNKETGIPLIATNDCHYIEPEDYEAHDILMAIQAKVTVDSDRRKKYGSDQFYVKSADEMWDLFGHTEQGVEALRNTQIISDRCNVELEFGKNKLPPFYVPAAFSRMENQDFLRYLVEEGMKDRYGENIPAEYVERMDFELKTIHDMGFDNYFLITWDFFRFCREGTNNYGEPISEQWNPILTGPGRGSGAGSICLYCLKITHIDPMKYALLFERFLDPSRISMPDIDSDYPRNRREEVIEYARQKYGIGSVCQIVTMSNMNARGIIRNVGRAISMSGVVVDRVAKLIPMDLNMTIDSALNISSQLCELYSSDSDIKFLIDISKKLEGLPKATSKHAAGVLITDEEGVTAHVPVFYNKNGNVVSQYSKDWLESLGLLKMDFLGLMTLDVIQGAIDRIAQNYGKKIDVEWLYTVPDAAPFSLMCSGNTEGIFQIESPGMTEFFTKLQPTSLDDVTLGISMYRPGPMDLIPQMLANKHDMSKVRYSVNGMKDILEATYGVFCYQEQLMQIVCAIGGYTRSDSDGFRKVVAKKKQNLVPLHRKWFIDGRKINDVDEKGRTVTYKNEIPGGVKLGHDREALKKIFDEMEEFAKYSFNKSHGAAYAVIAYTTAYLAYYYPQEFFASVLDFALGNETKMTKYINHLRSINIEVSEVDINKSGLTFVSEPGKGIIYPLRASGVKNTAVEEIVRNRPSDGYKDMAQFLARNVGLDKSTFNSLAAAGAFSVFGYTRSSLMAGAEDIFTKLKKKLTGLKLSEAAQLTKETFDQYIPNLSEFREETILKLEKEYLKHYLSGNPLDYFANEVRECSSSAADGFKYMFLKNFEYSLDEDTGTVTAVGNIIDKQRIKVIAVINDLKLMTTKKHTQMCRLEVLDTTGSANIVVFPQCYETYKNLIEKDAVYEFQGSVQLSDDSAPQINLISMAPCVKSGSLERCLFYLNTKKDASDLCLLLSKQKGKGVAIPTYFNIGHVRLLIPEVYWIRRDVLGAIKKNQYYYELTM